MKHFAVIVQKQNQHKIFTSVFIFGTLYFFTIAFSLCKNYPLDRRQRRRTMTLRTLYRYMGALTCPVTKPLKNRFARITVKLLQMLAARSALGAPERGAGSPNGLTEGLS